MNYLKITNQGHIVAEDLMLIGSSTKRDQTGKIGMFGSGWKYALSWLLRNDCKPVIYSGNTEIVIDYKMTLHRDNPIRIITVDGKETSLTTEMGPQWTGWMALREIVSNAIDEGNYSITTELNPQFTANDGLTTIYIPMNRELQEVMLNFNSYFAFYREEDYKVDTIKNKQYGGRIFIKSQASPMNIYRKGIRCFDGKYKSVVDFDFDEILINESRLTEYYSIEEQAQSILASGIPTEILLGILKNQDQIGRYDGLNVIPSYINDRIYNSLVEMLQKHSVSFTTDTIKRLGGMFVSSPDVVTIRRPGS